MRWPATTKTPTAHHGAPCTPYKALEAPVVILTDVDGTTPQLEDLLYIGATRATERLVVPPRSMRSPTEVHLRECSDGEKFGDTR